MRRFALAPSLLLLAPLLSQNAMAAGAAPDLTGKWKYAPREGQSPRSNVGNLIIIEQKGEQVVITSGWNEQNPIEVLTCHTNDSPCALEQKKVKIENKECKAHWDKNALVTACSWPLPNSQTITGMKYRYSLSADKGTLTVQFATPASEFSKDGKGYDFRKS